MITIRSEQEHDCLITDENCWTVVERRAGKYHPLGHCSQPGVTLDQPEAARLFRYYRTDSEESARQVLAEVAGEWRRLAEHVR